MKRRPKRPAVAASVARTIRFATALARFIKETTDRYLPTMKVWNHRRDRYWPRRRSPAFFSSGTRQFVFTGSPTRTIITSTRMSASKTEFSMVTCHSSMTQIHRGCRAHKRRRAGGSGAWPRAPHERLHCHGTSNDSELKWEANKEPDVAGYEIVWRDTTAATWTNSRSVGNVLTYAMKGMSKDNFFGVRAVDKDGNRSTVSYPRPLPRTRPGTAPAASTAAPN